MIQQQNTETEIKIIAAATEIFLQKGKDGARMQEIANKAGINKALLHYYFRSKDKLFEKVFYKEVRTMLNTTLDSVTETDNFEKFLKLFISNYIDNVALRKNLFRFIFWESENFMKNVTDQFSQVFKNLGFQQNPVISKVKKAIADGQIRKLDPNNFALSLISMCLFPIIAAPVLSKVATQLDVDNLRFWKKRKQEIFNLIWNGIKP